MMKRIAYLPLSMVLLISVAACELVSADDEAQRERELVGPIWQLVAFEETDGTTVTVDADLGDEGRIYYTLRFTDSVEDDCGPGPAVDTEYTGCLYVTGHPNEGYSGYSVERDNILTVTFWAVTEISPPPESKEKKFFTALDDAISYEIEGDRLRIAYDDKALIFEARGSEMEEEE